MVLTLLIISSLFSSIAEKFSEYRMQLKATERYEQKNYREALNLFTLLATPERSEEVQARASFGLACSLFMEGRFQDSAAGFARSAKLAGENRELQHRALFNEGKTLAMAALSSPSVASKTQLFRQALNRFRTVLIGNPDDTDAKVNYEIVYRYLSDLEPERKTPPPPDTQNRPRSGQQPTMSSPAAARLLEQSRENEAALMRGLPSPKTGTHGYRSNSKAW